MKKFLLGVEDYHEFEIAKGYFKQMGMKTSFKEIYDPGDCDEEIVVSPEIIKKFQAFSYVAEFTILKN